MTEPRRSEPIRWDPQILRAYPGRWVALHNGRVVADAAEPSGLVPGVKALTGLDVVVQRVPHPDDVMDMGWMSLPGAW